MWYGCQAVRMYIRPSRVVVIPFTRACTYGGLYVGCLLAVLGTAICGSAGSCAPVIFEVHLVTRKYHLHRNTHSVRLQPHSADQVRQQPCFIPRWWGSIASEQLAIQFHEGHPGHARMALGCCGR